MLGNSSLLRLLSILVTATLASWTKGDGWTVLPATSAFAIIRPSWKRFTSTTALTADKPKRRKRKTASDEDSTDDSLPDFDITDESSASLSSESASSSNRIGSVDEITAAMMGSSYQKETSVSDLIRDRSLESKFQFDDTDTDTTLPDLAILPTAVGKKKARQAARIAAAEKKQEEEDANLLSKIPFIRDEKGEVSALKILENGTWLGIGLLVGWELYINSPFFDRAQPMIPVIYDILV